VRKLQLESEEETLAIDNDEDDGPIAREGRGQISCPFPLIDLKVNLKVYFFFSKFVSPIAFFPAEMFV